MNGEHDSMENDKKERVMTINLPENLERSVRSEVDSGNFASVDDAIAEAVRLWLRQRNGTETEKAGEGEQAAPPHKPIWDVFEEITAGIPEEDWARLPVDG